MLGSWRVRAAPAAGGGRRTGRRALAVGAVLAVSLALATAPAAPSAVGATCPQAYPVAQVTVGMKGTGLTVSKGAVPEHFSVEVLGVLTSPIWPGVDMVIVKADSPAIRRVGGIWAGMSGSPVYARDGRLIGAVAYGLSGAPSQTAGLTPAESMLPILGFAAQAQPRARRASLPPQLQQKIVASGAATAAAASGGMAQLAVPVSVSGLGQNRLGTLRESLTRAGLGPAVLYAGSAATGAPASGPVVAGGNFAAALSYGDVTAAGIGTTTLVCSKRALAFGHPFFLSGRTTMSAHLADALYVQPDALYGSYKVANVTGLVGTVDQDRATGLHAQLGAGPPTTVVTSHVAASGGLSRDGTTRVSQPSVVPGITRSHLLSNLNVVLQHIGEGTAQVSWTVTGTTTSGATWTLTDRNRVASPSDVTGAATEPLGWLETVRDNRFTDVTFSSIRLQASADDVYRQYSLDGVEVKVGDEYLPVDPMSPVVAAPGSTLALRAVLTPYRDRGTTRRVPFSFTVPAGLAGQTFGVELVGGASTSGPDPTQATSFADLLDRLRAQPQRDQVIARVYSGMGPAEEVGTASLDQVVSGSRFVSVQVTGAGTTR